MIRGSHCRDPGKARRLREERSPPDLLSVLIKPGEYPYEADVSQPRSNVG
jgi:hypothetical protein